MGRPKKVIPPVTITSCIHCGKEINPETIINVARKESVCPECLYKIYDGCLSYYKKKNYNNPKKAAIKKVCMMLDWYYDEFLFNAVAKKQSGIIQAYIKMLDGKKLLDKSYDDSVVDSVINSIRIDIEPKVNISCIHSDKIVEKTRIAITNRTI